MLKAIFTTALSLVLLAWLVPTVNLAGITSLILASIVASLLFGLVKPILNLLFLPINFVTLGVFSAILNVFLLWITIYLVPGLEISPMSIFGYDLSQFWTLMVISLLLGIIQSTVRAIFR